MSNHIVSPTLKMARVDPAESPGRDHADRRDGRGAPLEIVRVGRPEAPYRVFLRARAHAWEPGGNWVVEGL